MLIRHNKATIPVRWRFLGVAILVFVSHLKEPVSSKSVVDLPGIDQLQKKKSEETARETYDSTGKQLRGLLAAPYFGEITSGTASLSWVTDTAGMSEVHYSQDFGYGMSAPAASHDYDEAWWHSVTLTGLSSGTTYFYKIYTDGIDMTPWNPVSFKTAPSPLSTEFMFLVAGDSRPPSASEPPSSEAIDIAAQISSHAGDFVLHMGDIVHSGGICSGEDSSWKQYIRAFMNLYENTLGSRPIYTSFGNHDVNDGTCGIQAYTEILQMPLNAPVDHLEEYYSFDYANAHFICLDTNQPYDSASIQYQWFENDLQSTDRSWILVFFHHPAYSSGSHGSTGDVLIHLVPLMELYGVDIVFSGHDHDYERTFPLMNGAISTVNDGGITYIVTGGAGAPIYSVGSSWFTASSQGVYHFLTVTIDDCLMSIHAIDNAGITIDTVEINHCTQPDPTPTPISTPVDEPVGLGLTVVMISGLIFLQFFKK